MLKDEKLDNILNIYYIKENNNSYTKVIFPEKELKISLKEGRELLEKMIDDENLRKKLSKKGFYRFYYVINKKYHEIAFDEFKKEDLEIKDIKITHQQILQETYHLSKEERNKKIRTLASESIEQLHQRPKITFERRVDPNYEKLCNQAQKAKEILKDNSEIEKIYLYEIIPNTEMKFVVYYKNGKSASKTRDEFMYELVEFMKRNKIKSIDQLYDMGIMEDVPEEKINTTFEEYSVKNADGKENIGKIVLYSELEEDKAAIFYTDGTTEITSCEKAISKIIVLKRENNAKETRQLFRETKIESAKKIELYRNFEKYRQEAMKSKKDTNQYYAETSPKDLEIISKDTNQYYAETSPKDLEIISVDDYKKPKTVHGRKKKDKKVFKEIIENLMNNFLQGQLRKPLVIRGIIGGLTGAIALVASSCAIKLVQNSVTGMINKSSYNVEADNSKLIVGNQYLKLNLQSTLVELEQEIKKSKEKREKALVHQSITKKTTVPQEEKHSGVPAEDIIIEEKQEQQIEEKDLSTQKEQTEENNSPVEEQNVPTPQQEPVPENTNQPQATNYIATYSLTPEQIDVIKATVQHEAGFNDIEVTAVMSTVINRCRSGRWGGTDPWSVITAPGQFSSYGYGYYTQYINGNYADYTDTIVNQMLTGEKEPMHGYERFTGGGSGVQFTPRGNHYR